MVAKTGPAVVLAASNFSYTISVRDKLWAFTRWERDEVTDSLPAGITFVSASGNGTNIGGKVTWSLGTMPAFPDVITP